MPIHWWFFCMWGSVGLEKLPFLPESLKWIVTLNERKAHWRDPFFTSMIVGGGVIIVGLKILISRS